MLNRVKSTWCSRIIQSCVMLLNNLLEHQQSQVFWRKKLSGGATTTATERHHHVHTKPQRKTLRKANRLNS